jgi:hypothetical protein
MFLNFTNHPSSQWCEAQLAAAREYGPVRDMTFPVVPPEWDIGRVCAYADGLFAQICALRPAAVLCQGEMTLTYQLVKRLCAAGIPVLCACSQRVTEEKPLPNGATQKVSRFVFCGFRRYEAPEEA